MKKIISTLIIFTCIFLRLSSQERVLSYPTPEASNLGKYGQVPVSYFNGLPQISIPIYTIKVRDMELPISLTYHAQGNKPDEHPSWVGLGWNLNTGGMITRVINGVRDELTRYDFAEELGANLTLSSEIGYFYRMNEFYGSSWYSALLPKLIGANLEYNFLDTQPDEFIFNFNGYSGSFFFVDNNGKIDVKVKSKKGIILKVEPFISESYMEFSVFKDHPDYYKYKPKYRVNKTFKKFIVTTADGVKYIFGGDIENIDFTTTLKTHKFGNPITVASSWHLSRIISPKGDYIDFEYFEGGTVFMQNKSKYHYIAAHVENEKICYDYNNSIDGAMSAFIIHPKYLHNIRTSNNQRIFFFALPSNQLNYNWDYVLNNHSQILAGLLPSGLPLIKKCFSKSYFYELGEIDINLEKSIRFIYSNSDKERLRLSCMEIKSMDNLNPMKYSFDYNPTYLPEYNSQKIDNWGYYNNKDFSNNLDYENLYTFRKAVLDKTKAEILESIQYPTGGITKFKYELNQYSKFVNGLVINEQEINNGPFSLIKENGEAGGLRIKKIINYANLNDPNPTTEKTYTYINKDGTSSGTLSGKPIYHIEGKRHIKYCYSGWEGLGYYKLQADYIINFVLLSQNLLIPLSTTDGNHITYSRVIETDKDGGQTIYSYSNHNEFINEVPISLITNIDSRTFGESFTSKELERGLLKSLIVLNKNNKIIRETYYEYNDDPDRYNDYVKTINRYTLESDCGSDFYRFSANKIYTFYPYLKKKTETKYDINGKNPVTVTTNFDYNKNWLEKKIITKDSKQLNVEKELKYSGDDLGANNVYFDMKSKNILNYPIEITTKKNNIITESNLITYKLQNNLYVPDKIFKTELSSPLSNFTYFNGTTKDSHYGQSPEIEYTKYDQYGNIIEIKAKDGMPTSYILSYNNQYPIAEIVNASYVDVEAALGGENVVKAFAKKRNPTLQEIQTFLAPVFTNSNTKNAMITYYTYQPLIGMTSKTEPNGVTTYYEYDGFGRLQYIKDNNGNIIEKYDYHYKP